MDTTLLRMLDANANRAREALRVLEDYARFALNDEHLSADLKHIRHELAAVLTLPSVGGGDAILSRDTEGDVGTDNKTARELTRANLAEVVIAAGKRLSEALRVIEEVAKTADSASAARIEKLRYRGYTLEQILTRAVSQSGRFATVRLYVLVTESLCKLPWEKTLDEILSMKTSPFSVCVQLREKDLPDVELLARARHLVARCRAANALAIINDRPDIALLAHADGIHLGQTDLPCAEARKLLGHAAIIGVSTENLTQARQAVRDGATYIGVGPMFPTTTKEKPRLAGPAYAQEALANIPLPTVAIGGITPQNLPELAAVGVKCIAACAAIISDPNPAERCREFLTALCAPATDH